MKRIFKSILRGTALASLAALAGWASAQPAGDTLEQGFKSPPDSAKPRTWWHWTNGNVTKEGITKDLEWMKRVGIGGMHLADVGSGSGQTVEKKILFGSPEWFDAVRHAASEADRLGLEMTIFSSAGWSETGGPWVKPEQAMKKLVWSETAVSGPQKFTGKLPQPPSLNGSFGGLGRPGLDPTYYGDSAVIAFRTPADESDMKSLNPKVTASSGAVNGAALMDGNLNTAVAVPASEETGAAWVQYEFEQPFKARAVTLVGPGRGIPLGSVLASDDGKTFRPLAELPGPEQYRAGTVRTFSFPETTARFFRVVMTAPPLDPAAVMSQAQPQPAMQYSLGEFVLHSGARVNHWEEKVGFNFYYQYDGTPTPPVPAASAIGKSDIIDLTSKMSKDGALDWDVPEGKWTVLRLGYSLTGAKNRPAPPTGSGYEVDKLSKKYVEGYYHGYFDPLEKALGPLFGKSLRYVMMDSWEAGMQNWTDEMIGEFTKRRGYDLTPWLPVLTGRVVGSAELSDRFLWDFRRTLADMFADNHFGTMSELLKKKGIGIYGEAAGVSMEIMEDTLLNKSKVDIPMGEFWVGKMHPDIQYYVDVRGAASASHAYGKTLVATESFTGGQYEAPFTLKKVVDYWFAQGVNRIVFHTSAQQPLDTKPGNTMVGTHINRNITWAEQAKPFMDYLARNSYMLQQGLFVADLAYLLPEGAPSSQPFWGAGIQPAPPEGYDYDCINTDVLLNRMTVAADGRLVLPDGMSYRALVLPQIDRMTPAVARKIRELAAGGAIVIGPKPANSPSLAGYPEADREVQTVAGEVWGDLDGIMRNKNYYGKGLVVCGLPPAAVLASAGIVKDFEYAKGLDADVPWIHRRAGQTDIYYLANRTDSPQAFDARFRVAGKAAELWHPDSGKVEPVGYSAAAAGRTVVPLSLAPRESVFVVFREKAAAPARTLAQAAVTTITTIEGPWTVSFPEKMGAPAQVELAELAPWSKSTDEGVKYFSGTATYTKTGPVPEEWLQPGAKLILDLGRVNDIAEVTLNGQKLATLWKPPYQVDVTGAIKAGENRLEIKVTNEWTNRIAGDRLAPADKKILSQDAGARGMMGGMGGGAMTGAGARGARGAMRGGLAMTTGTAARRGAMGAAGARGARGGAGGGGFGFGMNQPLPESGLLGPVALLAKTERN